jgi:hypothetical protein
MKTYVTSRWKALRDKIVGTKPCQHTAAEQETRQKEYDAFAEQRANARAYLDKSYEDFKASCSDPENVKGISEDQLDKLLRRAFFIAVMGPDYAAHRYTR